MSLELPQLNLPQYEFPVRLYNSDASIYDSFRKKYVKLTPEEWVRQNFARYLVEEKACPMTRIRLEASLTVNGLAKRCDIVVYGKDFNPLAVVECKAHSVELSQKTLQQIGTYNLKLNVDNLIITNGLVHYFIKIDRVSKSFSISPDVPAYSELS